MNTQVKYITLKEAAHRAGLSESQTARYVRRLGLGIRKFGAGRWVINEGEFLRFLHGGASGSLGGGHDR